MKSKRRPAAARQPANEDPADDETLTITKLAKDLASGQIGGFLARIDLSAALGPLNEKIASLNDVMAADNDRWKRLSETISVARESGVQLPEIRLPEMMSPHAPMILEQPAPAPQPVEVNVELDYTLLADALLDRLEQRIRQIVADEMKRQMGPVH